MINCLPSTFRRLRWFAAVAMLMAAPAVQAQTPAFVVEPVFVVAFVDVDPKQADQVLTLLRTYAEVTRHAPGVRRCEVLRELARTNHFTLLEAWDSEAARQASQASEATRQFRARLQPLLASPFDERLSHPEPF